MTDIGVTGLSRLSTSKMLSDGYRVHAVIPTSTTGPGHIIWERHSPPAPAPAQPSNSANLSGRPDTATPKDRHPVHIPPLTAAERVQPSWATQAPTTPTNAPSGPEIAKSSMSDPRGPSTGEYVQLRNAFLNAYEMPNIDPEDLLAKYRAAFPEVAQMMQTELGLYLSHERDLLVVRAIEFCLAHDKLHRDDRAKLTELRDALDSDSYLILTTKAPGEKP